MEESKVSGEENEDVAGARVSLECENLGHSIEVI